MGETDKGYSWFPGMFKNNDKRSKNTSIDPIFYDVEVHSKNSEIPHDVFTTVFTYYMGNIICTGYYPDNGSFMVDIITKMIKENEDRNCKYCRISECLYALNVLIILDRREDV